MNTPKKVGKNTFRLCGVGPACPTVRINKKSVTIKDDFGGSVKIKREEFEMMKKLMS